MQNKSSADLISFQDAILEAHRYTLQNDDSVILIGEGVPDPKAIFGTTKGLKEEFGPDRVMDMPLSENGMTGILIGAALQGLKPVMVHQRSDFLLLAMDQLVNNAAKWHWMFDRQYNVPITIRALIGRGWGQGPQHSQSLQGLFSHIPGLKVVMPVTPSDAKGMLIAATYDPNPVIFLEHRWLHPIKGPALSSDNKVSLSKAKVLRKGRSVTVAGFSHTVIEALKVSEVLAEHKIEIEVIDMRSANPIDGDTVSESVKNTGCLAVLDTGFLHCGVSSEVVAQVSEKAHIHLKKAPVRIAMPDHPIPTSFHVANPSYPEASDIALQILKLCDITDPGILADTSSKLERKGPLDVPYLDFTGPF